MIDYTYGGTEDDPDVWSDIEFSFDAIRRITFGDPESGPSGDLTQPGLLTATWDNDYLSLGDGSTLSLVVQGYQIDITPLGLAEVGGSNFSGSNPWVQPSRDVMAQFTVTLAPSVPTPSSLAALISMGAMGLVAVARRRRKHA